jgi:ketosteroid isomerase-like protein
MLDILIEFAGLTEHKRFGEPTRQFVSGDYVVTEHPWEATFTTEVPGFAEEGETVKRDLCSIWEIRDGKIVEYDDYG